MRNDSFFEMVNANPTLSERFAKVCAEVIQTARELHGVQLDHTDVAMLLSARASTLGAHDLDDFRDELAALDKVRARNPAKAKPAVKTPDEAPQLDDARVAARKFAEARANGFKSPENAPVPLDEMSDIAKLRYLTTLPPGDARKITLGRRWGLIR
jgi:hypothetical protein